MQLRTLLIIVVLNTQFGSLSAAQCRQSNDHKNYTCNGFRFREFTVSRPTKLQILRARIFDCKETQIPEIVLSFPNLQNLTISCDIEAIHENAFGNLKHLQELDLHNNTLSTLPQHLFQLLGALQTLNLSSNNFEKLTRNMFQGLNNLKQLIISHNAVSELDISVFEPLSQLEEIFFNNNRINVIPVTTFNRLRKLRILDLSHNSINTLPDMFVSLHNLLQLNISHNSIQDLPARIFHANRLEVLDLSWNELTTVYEDSLALDSLRELYLQNNRISLLDIRALGISKIPLNLLDLKNNRLVFLEESFIKVAKNLVTFKIEGNPWDCSCFDTIVMLRTNLSLDISTEYHAGEQPLCIIVDSNGCNVNKNNLTVYYNMFQEQLELK